MQRWTVYKNNGPNPPDELGEIEAATETEARAAAESRFNDPDSQTGLGAFRHLYVERVDEPEPVRLDVTVPTYHCSIDGEYEFREPRVPVTVEVNEGIELTLGQHTDDFCAPAVYAERRERGWCIVINNPGGGDASGMLYLFDDGRTVLVREKMYEDNLNIALADESPEEIDQPVETVTP